eukprot:2463501-Prymnesium_polylepis.1
MAPPTHATASPPPRPNVSPPAWGQAAPGALNLSPVGGFRPSATSVCMGAAGGYQPTTVYATRTNYANS